MQGSGIEDTNVDEELSSVHINLKAIENVMIAETRRREESNQLMNEFIEDFLSKLQEGINT